MNQTLSDDPSQGRLQPPSPSRSHQEDSWEFMRDELEAFQEALQSFDETSSKLLIVESQPKIQKKKPPLMPKPQMNKNGALNRHSLILSSGRCNGTTTTPSTKPYMETDI